MRIKLNKLHFPVTTLGPGRRIGIWFQGCTIGCKGCISRDTWSADERATIDIDVILDWCRSQAGQRPEGVTISGGEPFEQPDALTFLLDRLSEWRKAANLPIDILCYSGFPFKRLQRDFSDILSRLDAVIPEPFSEKHLSDKPWRGSANQPLIVLSELGRNRYAPFVNLKMTGKGNFQVEIQEGRIWFVGIPRRGDMQKLEETCRTRGIIHGPVSWRA